jgi:nitrogen regulatory protein PII-like uncharacterized protein
MTNEELLKARKNIFSQNGEDGVIEYLFNYFEIENGSFCEFGAWDGIYLSNTYNLLKNKNWKGVYIEGDSEKYKKLIELKEIYNDKVQTINSYVSYKGENKLDNLLKNTFLDKNFDLLSIDIDGMDYHIWKAVEEYKPKLVIIEVNSNLRPGDLYISEVDTANSWIGTGFSAVCELGIAKGYYPIIHFGNVFLGEINFLKEKKYNLNLDIPSMYNW